MTLALPILTALPPVATTPEVDELLRAHAPVAIGVSGGKDSTAAAFATIDHLDAIGHAGPRILIHSDLGVTEWPYSIEWCHKLADRLGLELLVVRRAKGDMMDRWGQRWRDNVARYAELRCVKLIMPWSAPNLRFCTSEMKVDVICRELSRRFVGKPIVSVCGIRRQESNDRKNAPIYAVQPKLDSVTRNTGGISWQPLVNWTLDDVFALHRERDFPLHPAYTEWGVSRVSCMECILQSDADARAVVKYPGSHGLHRRLVSLEIESTFAFQSGRWRGDLAPELLNADMRQRLRLAKNRAEMREEYEAGIPKHLLYTKGWPTCMPTRAEAELLKTVRRAVAGWVGLKIQFDDTDSILLRYAELMTAKRAKKPRRAA